MRPVPVTMFSINGERPRLVIDFPNSIYRKKNLIPLPEGELAENIRIGLHKEPKIKARIVIDLSKIYAVDYKHSFTESENLLEVVLTRGAILEKTANIPQEKKKAPVANDVLPVTDEKTVISPAVDTKTITPAVDATEEVKDAPPVVSEGSPTPCSARDSSRHAATA